MRVAILYSIVLLRYGQNSSGFQVTIPLINHQQRSDFGSRSSRLSDSKEPLISADDIFVDESSRKEEKRKTGKKDNITTKSDISTNNGEANEEDSKFSQKKSLTQRLMETTTSSGQTGGAGGVSTWDAFLRAENLWTKLKASSSFEYDPMHLQKKQNNGSTPPPPTFLTSDGAKGNPACWQALQASSGKMDYDVVVCGGTLGIFVATALALKGHTVAVVEGGKLKGREQEWNISMDEIMELVKLGVLSKDEVDQAITTQFDGCRAGFKNKEAPTVGGYFENNIGYECFTPNVLNLGVSPSLLLEQVAARFESLGGRIIQETPIKGICVSESEGAALDLGTEKNILTSRLVLDCMGNASPISRQQRYGQKPDGICVVVGSCAGGYDADTNLLGDIIYTNTEIQDKAENGQLQYFWEAFPVGIGGKNGMAPGESDVKTTYMFSYLDASADRPSLHSFMDDYWKLLPIYQPSISNPETDLNIKRILFAFFPTYRNSPLPSSHSRVLAVGDASGIQSPLSFGGFGALTRHLDRQSTAISEALAIDCLHKDDLREINAYTPNLSAAWMFQKAMSVRMGQSVDSKFVNRLLATNFEIMHNMGKKTIMPFLQDVVRIDGLLGSLSRSFVADPLFTPQIINHVGIPALVDWMGHVTMIGAYTGLHRFATPLLNAMIKNRVLKLKEREEWKLRRKMEAWEFGSGSDYVMEGSEWEEDKRI